MFSQTGSVIEKLHAFFVSTKVFLSIILWDMGLGMLFEISGRSESLCTLSTLEGLFTSVDFLVSFKV
jgi:hypothetical protein